MAPPAAEGFDSGARVEAGGADAAGVEEFVEGVRWFDMRWVASLVWAGVTVIFVVVVVVVVRAVPVEVGLDLVGEGAFSFLKGCSGGGICLFGFFRREKYSLWLVNRKWRLFRWLVDP